MTLFMNIYMYNKSVNTQEGYKNPQDSDFLLGEKQGNGIIREMARASNISNGYLFKIYLK